MMIIMDDNNNSDDDNDDSNAAVGFRYLYWTDGGKDIIERADLTGNDRQLVVAEGGNLVGLALNDKG